MKQQKTIKWIHTVWVTACAVLFQIGRAHV